jgi:hypothetical protein
VTASAETRWQHQPCSAVVDLPPLGVVYLAARRPAPEPAAAPR